MVGRENPDDTGDEGDTSSPQLFGIDGSDEVLLSLIQVGEQRGVFLLQFFFSCSYGKHSTAVAPL